MPQSAKTKKAKAAKPKPTPKTAPPKPSRANDAQVSAAAAVASAAGYGRSLARTSAPYSWQLIATSTRAITRNSHAGEYQTAAMVSAIMTTPLMMRVVTWRRAPPLTA